MPAIVTVPSQTKETRVPAATQWPEVLGFIQRSEEPSFWDACTNLDKLMAAPRSECVLAKTRQDAVAALHKRFPSPHRDLPRVTVFGTTYTYAAYGSTSPNYAHDGGPAGKEDTLRVWDHPMYFGDDIEEAISLAKSHGRIICNKLTKSFFYASYNGTERKRLYAAGCHLSDANEIVYNPKKARAFARRRELQRPQDLFVTAPTVVCLTYKFASELELDNIGTWMSNHSSYYSSRQNAAYVLKQTVQIFNMVYGLNAHRQLAAFQTFKQEWKRTLVRTRKSWKQAAAQLCEWMDFEITRRKPKPRNLRQHCCFTEFYNPLREKDDKKAAS